MDAGTLEKILAATDGFTQQGDRHVTAEGHRATFYLGEGSGAIPVREVKSVALGDGFLDLETKDAHVYAALATVRAIEVKADPEAAGRKTGFA